MRKAVIMPCLDIKDGRVVKGINFLNLQDAGDPAQCALVYAQNGADELAFLDITATIEKRGTTLQALRQITSTVDIPVTVGGGIKSVADAENVLAAGAHRVSISSAALKDPILIEQIAARYGSDKVVVAIDVGISDKLPSGYEAYINGGRTATGKDAVVWAQEAVSLGAGMVLPTSKNRDGAKNGYDIVLIKAIKNVVKVPVIASGGAGTMQHFYQAVTKAQADILLAASVFHFGQIKIMELKRYLQDQGVSVNMA